MQSKTSDFIREILISNESVSGLSFLPVPGDDTLNARNMMDFFRHIALTSVQTHSTNVKVVEKRFDRTENFDALVTFKRDLPIGVFTADCVPILIYAPDVQGIAAVHAGWRGTLGGIVDNTLEVLDRYGASSEKMAVAFGPSISMRNYEVDDALAERFITAGFSEYVTYPDGKSGKPHIDLQGVNMERFLRKGVMRENIRLHSGCTYDTRDNDGSFLYQSYRRSGNSAGRMLTSIMLTD